MQTSDWLSVNEGHRDRAKREASKLLYRERNQIMKLATERTGGGVENKSKNNYE